VHKCSSLPIHILSNQRRIGLVDYPQSSMNANNLE